VESPILLTVTKCNECILNIGFANMAECGIENQQTKDITSSFPCKPLWSNLKKALRTLCNYAKEKTVQRLPHSPYNLLLVCSVLPKHRRESSEDQLDVFSNTHVFDVL